MPHSGGRRSCTTGFGMHGGVISGQGALCRCRPTASRAGATSSPTFPMQVEGCCLAYSLPVWAHVVASCLGRPTRTAAAACVGCWAATARYAGPLPHQMTEAAAIKAAIAVFKSELLLSACLRLMPSPPLNSSGLSPAPCWVHAALPELVFASSEPHPRIERSLNEALNLF